MKRAAGVLVENHLAIVRFDPSVDLEGTEAPLTNPSIEQFDDAVVVVDANGLGPKGEEPLRFGAPRAEVPP